MQTTIALTPVPFPIHLAPSEDAPKWLRAAFDAALDQGPWGALQGAALASIRSGGSRLAQILAGTASDPFEDARRWVQSLAPAQRESLRDLVRADAVLLLLELDDVDALAGEEGWAAAVEGLLLRRDELAGAQVVLDAAGELGDVEALLASLDKSLRGWMAAQPVVPRCDHPRLQAARRSPLAYWADWADDGVYSAHG